MRNRKGNTQRRVINARNELRQVTHGTHQNPGHTYIHACIHAHTARIGKTSLYFNGVHDCIHFPFFFSFFIPYFLFSFFLYSILCILLFLFLPYSWACIMGCAVHTSAVILVETAYSMIQSPQLNFKSESAGYWIVSVESLT